MSTCAFSSGFDAGFEICVAVSDTREPTRGVPVLPPRKRAVIREVRGRGIIQVIGAGRLTGEAALSGVLLVDVTGYGRLIAEAHRLLIGAVHIGAEAVLAGEWAIREMLPVHVVGVARFVLERAMVAVGVVVPAVVAVVRREWAVAGRLPVRSGAEAVLIVCESDEQAELMLLGLPSELGA